MERNIDWDVLLPDHQWKKRTMKSWEELMPPPRTQVHIPGIGGSCTIHACAESFTVSLRQVYSTKEIAVDLPRLLQLAIDEQILTASGSSLAGVNFLARTCGIPLEAPLPTDLHEGFQLREGADVYAIGTRVKIHAGKPLPFANPTCKEVKDAMEYREELCELLDVGPLVICCNLQKHYHQRFFGEPYYLKEGKENFVTQPKSWWQWLSFADPQIIGHCVTAYGYWCPGGDVRSLRLLCQDNMIGADDRLMIHPDAVRTYAQTFAVDALLSDGFAAD